jgi:asparagine synthase (glutamine-hydrolysing)
LERKIIDFAHGLPIESKLSKAQNKIILRKLAMELGAPIELAFRKKTAAQYGSNSDKAIEKLAKQAGAKGKADYLSKIANARKIAALFSGGKDSCFSLWLMQKQGFDVACLVSVLPKQHDSFMYHKPNEKVLKLQAKALGISLLLKPTRGEKEKELLDLKKALVLAKKRFGIQGVVSGALYSNYQRERIQKICDELKIKLFSPLWHKKQEQELQELLDNGFVFVMTKIAALGLNKEWLGKKVGKKELVELEKLQASFGFNVAGEGGEYESLVLQAPNFKKKIRIVSSEKKMLNDCTGVLEIKKAVF